VLIGWVGRPLFAGLACVSPYDHDFVRLGSSAVVGGGSSGSASRPDSDASPGPEEDIGDLDWLDPFIDQARPVGQPRSWTTLPGIGHQHVEVMILGDAPCRWLLSWVIDHRVVVPVCWG
jgi:hypothetical protein